MNTNGYVVVDCTGINLLSETEVTVPGIYAKVAEAVKANKAIIATGCEYGSGVPVTPIHVFAINDDGTYICTTSIYQISIASDDGVTITSLVS